ncbi:oligosaccharide flippase family protein [Ferroplasma sp.]|uniref:oligosaccharide flippase family protein n=1 Tax=Ferroplasma sp. TaxID=2591003 RepID=UPI002627D949|nr:oligosaccharide flippase family protein [Ferroplasma sp.]MCL4452969.1 oligosaccharide flippase family protein [Candidatus Thermoplasmatota archaeon]
MIAKKSPLLVFGQIINSLFGYIGLFFIIRFVGLQAWGFLSFSLAFIGVLSIVGDLGYGTAHLRFLSSGEYDEGQCNGTFLTVRAVQTFITVSIVLLSLLVWLDVLHRGFQSNVEIYTIILLLPYFFFNRLKDVPNIYFNSKMKSARMSIPQITEAIVRNSLFIILGTAYILKIPGYNTVSAAVIMAIIYSFSYFLYFIISFMFGRPWKFNRPSMKLFMAYTKIAYPLALASIIGSVSGNIDKVLIEFYWHAVATGAFASLQKITGPITTFSGTISVFFIPLLMRSSDHEKFKGDVSSFERIISLFILPAVVIFIALRVYVANLWSAALIPYADILIFLSISAYLVAINSAYSSSLVARGLTRRIGEITVVALIINIVLDLVLIPPSVFGITFLSLGVLGGAVSTFMAMLFETVAYRLIVLRAESMKPNLTIFYQLLPAAAQFIFLYWVTYYIPVYSIILFLPVAVVSIIIFLAFAILIRQITLRQVIEFIKALNPFSFRKAFRNE